MVVGCDDDLDALFTSAAPEVRCDIDLALLLSLSLFPAGLVCDPGNMPTGHAMERDVAARPAPVGTAKRGGEERDDVLRDGGGDGEGLVVVVVVVELLLVLVLVPRRPWPAAIIRLRAWVSWR